MNDKILLLMEFILSIFILPLLLAVYYSIKILYWLLYHKTNAKIEKEWHSYHSSEDQTLQEPLA